MNSQFRALAESFEHIRQQIACRPEDVMQAVVQVAVERLPAADWASITVLRGNSFHTAVATDERATAADQIQYELGSGPCVDAILEETVFALHNTRDDARWPQFSRRAAEELGVASMLSFSLNLDSAEVTGGLNLYSQRRGALEGPASDLGLLLATHGALAVVAANHLRRAENVTRALSTNREIGIAMGVLMNQHKVSRDQAFDLLRIASQKSHRKLRDIATEVADTGLLKLP